MKKVTEENLPKYLLLDTLVIDGAISVILAIFAFFNHYNLVLGFLLGSVISIINYLLICFQATIFTKPNPSVAVIPLVAIGYIFRFALYGVGLFLAFFLSYKGYDIFAWYTVFAAYLVIQILIYAKYGRYKGKKATPSF